MEDSALIQQLATGNNEAFRLLGERYGRMLYICAYKFVRDEEYARDITQEVFIEVFRAAGSFRKESKLSTWLYRITISKSLNHLKYLKRKKRFASVLRIFGKEEIEKTLVSPGAAEPQRLSEQQERIQVLHNAMAKLPDSQRVAFTLSKIEGMSYAEIAGVMGVTDAAVEALLHRAKTKLRKLLNNYYYENFK